MAYTIDPITADCYPGTTVLINKFNITDSSKLNKIESVLTSAKAAEWLKLPRSVSFDFEHYKAIHRYLFSDLYEWAGSIRTVNLSKKGTVFTTADKIELHAKAIFTRLRKCSCFKGLDRRRFINEITDFYCVTNDLHPFREGNGRTQRVFLTQLVQYSGYEINFADMDTDLLMIATIKASQGVTDLLHQMLDESIL